MNRSSKQHFVQRLISHSFILSLLASLFRKAKRSFRDGFFGHLLMGDHRTAKRGFLSYLAEKIGFRRRVSIPVKRFMARQCEQSLLLNLTKRGVAGLAALPLRSVGIFYFSAGLTLAVAYIIRRYALDITSISVSELAIGVIAAIAGSFLAVSRKRCGEALRESRLLSFFLFRTLGIPEHVLISDVEMVGRGDASFLFGIAVGCIGAITSSINALLAFPLLLLAFAVLVLPECGVVLIFLALPLADVDTVAALSLFVTGCWLFKVLRGKRNLSQTSLDGAVLAFALLILFGGLVSVSPKESSREAWQLLCLLSSYFAITNLIRTAAWVKRCVGALLFAGGAAALLGIGSAALGFVTSPSALGSLSSLIRLPSSTFSPDALAALLLLTFPFAMTVHSLSSPGDSRFGYAVITLLIAVTLLFTRSQSGLLAAVVSFLLLLLLTSRAGVIALLFIGALLLPLCSLLLPKGMYSRVSAILSIPGTSLAYGMDRFVALCFPCGIGVGETAFHRGAPLFTFLSEETASPNLYLRIITSLGVTGLILFFLLFLIFLRHYAANVALGKADSPWLKHTASAGATAVVGLLIMGATENVWADRRVFLLFFMILGLTSAAIRTATRERISHSLDGPHLDVELKVPPLLFRKRKEP